MAAGDQRWDPHLEDKMMRWTTKWAEREIDKAAKKLRSERQFRRKRPEERGVRVIKGVAARIDGDASGPCDEDGPMVVPPEDAASSEERARLAASWKPTLELSPLAPEEEAAAAAVRAGGGCGRHAIAVAGCNKKRRRRESTSITARAPSRAELKLLSFSDDVGAS